MPRILSPWRTRFPRASTNRVAARPDPSPTTKPSWIIATAVSAMAARPAVSVVGGLFIQSDSDVVTSCQLVVLGQARSLPLRLSTLRRGELFLGRGDDFVGSEAKFLLEFLKGG